MSYHRKDLDTVNRINITATMLHPQKTNTTDLANQYQLSRTSIYNIAKNGKLVLQAQFSQEKKKGFVYG